LALGWTKFNFEGADIHLRLLLLFSSAASSKFALIRAIRGKAFAFRVFPFQCRLGSPSCIQLITGS
jgi:hypothetical protein